MHEHTRKYLQAAANPIRPHPGALYQLQYPGMQPKTFQVMHLGMISWFTTRKIIPWAGGDNSAMKTNTTHLCLHFSFRLFPK